MRCLILSQCKDLRAGLIWESEVISRCEHAGLQHSVLPAIDTWIIPAFTPQLQDFIALYVHVWLTHRDRDRDRQHLTGYNISSASWTETLKPKFDYLNRIKHLASTNLVMEAHVRD